MEPENKFKPPTEEVAHQPRKTACDSMPDFTRLRYFYGQMLAAQDLQTEQDYFREKLKLLNRCLEGYGTVCGLRVVAVRRAPEYESPPAESADEYGRERAAQADPAQADPAKADPAQADPAQAESAAPEAAGPVARPRPVAGAWVEVECGLALDCEGNELIVRHPLRVELWGALSEAERREAEVAPNGRARLYLSICYCVQPIDPVRPVLPDACDAVAECVYSKLRDSVKVRVTTRKPRADHCRDNCCDKCADKCLLLAAIDLERGRPPVIHNDVRRWIGVYEPVTITGISWAHAGGYTPEGASRMLQQQGLTVEFSRPILPETVTRGVVDVIVFEGGKGRHSGMYYINGEVSIPDNRRIVFRDDSEELLENGDRVLVIVRTDFILDECCRPVDGNHVGGRVPLLARFAENRPQNGPPAARSCAQPPRRYGAWTSGSGTPGGTFESWFYVQRPPRPQPPPPPRPRDERSQYEQPYEPPYEPPYEAGE